MKRLTIFAIVFGVILAGCGSQVEDKYGEGREKQKNKAEKMVESETSPE